MGELPIGTVTFLFTDIEGSTRLLEELGAETYREALAEHRRVLREAFARYGGYEVDFEGDAFFVAFQEAAAGVAAALAAQAALAGGPIRVRMGLHTGEPLVDPPKYVGRDVHLGARIVSCGHGGQVLLSKATRELIDGEARDLGEHRLKDFAEPIWLFQLGGEAFPPLKTISNTNLPRPASSFVGREREVGEVTTRLRDGARLVTLTGPGGSGKTRLSIEAAAELVGEFRNGVFWVGLAAVRDPELVATTIAQTIGAQGELSAHVAEKELLLVLDNLEQVVGAAPGLARLVEACPNLALLVTSRELLRVRGEVEYEVLPLADPDAVELFCLRSGLEPGAAVEELCRRLDNMPLALELAAARTKTLTPGQILDRLGERLDLLKGGRDAEPRQATLRATIEWSYELLSPAEQRLFAPLGVFAGGCTLESAQAVADADLDTLQSFVEKSLLRRTDERFWMLETIREYAVERLEAAGDGPAVWARFAQFFLELADSANLCVETLQAGGTERPELVIPEQANLRSAVDWALDHDPDLGLRLAVALEQFWVMQSPFEGIRRFEALLDRAASSSPVLRGRAFRALGGSRYLAGFPEQALQANQRGLELFREAEDEAGVTTMTFRLGTVYTWLDEDMDRARRLLEESLEGFRRLGNRMGECEASGNLAEIELESGDPERGRELVEQNVELAREIGFTWWEAGKLRVLALYALENDRADDAERRAKDALNLSRRLADRRGTLIGLAIVAGAAAECGDAGRAGRLWGAIEAEERRGPIGVWEGERDKFVSRLGAVEGPDFERARHEGNGLSLHEAVDSALGESDD